MTIRVGWVLLKVSAAAIGMVLLASCQTGGGIRSENAPVTIDTEFLGLASDQSPVVRIDPRGARDGLQAVRIMIYESPDGDPIMYEREASAPVAGPISIPIPLAGLLDGAVYEARIELVAAAGTAGASPPVALQVSLDVPAPVPVSVALVTVGAAEPAIWAAVADMPDADIRWREAAGDAWNVDAGRDGMFEPSEDWLSQDGSEVEWQVRFATERGVRGPWSERARIVRSLERAIPELLSNFQGQSSIVATPRLSWSRVAGADRYVVELQRGAGTLEALTLGAEPFIDLSGAIVESLPSGAPGEPVVWRVAALTGRGERAPYSEVGEVLIEALAGSFVPILSSSAGVSVRMGDDASPEADERPAVSMTLTRPYEMQRRELSTAAAVAIVNAEIAAGRMRITEGAVRSSVDPDRIYIGLEDLAFGRQFGIIPGEDGLLRAAPGYESHPVVGVSWYGGAALANALSRLEGREPAYQGFETTDGVLRFNPETNGYRLPSEAEWAYAALSDQAPSARALRGSNFLRSGDRWEDPSDPFTRQGGPTTPVGALGYANARGLYDMLGNVWEWTGDWYDPTWFQQARDGGTSDGPDTPWIDVYGRALRVVRGGAWNTSEASLRPTNRGAFEPGATSHSIGLRFVRGTDPLP